MLVLLHFDNATLNNARHTGWRCLYDCCCCCCCSCCCCCPGGVPTDMIVMAISLARFRCNIYSPVKWLPHVLCYHVLSHPTPPFPTTLNPSMYLLFADGEGGYTGLYMSTTTMFSNSSSRISIYLFIYEINGGYLLLFLLPLHFATD